MAGSDASVSLSEELEGGSEEIPLSEAKFKLVGKITVDCEPSVNINQLSKCSKDELFLVVREKYNLWVIKKVSTSGQVLHNISSCDIDSDVAVVSKDAFLISRNKTLYHYNESRPSKVRFSQGCTSIGYIDGHLAFVRENKLIIKVIAGKLCGSFTQACVDAGYNEKTYISAVKENGIGFFYVSCSASLNSNQITKLSLDGRIMSVVQ